MKSILFALSIVAFLACNTKDKDPKSEIEMKEEETWSYLALGDSYTIGEGVSEADRYPNQLIRILKQESDINYASPKIIAKTGWTVDELEEGIKKETLNEQPFDLVTLLIGVNNQYRGKAVEDFKIEFEQLLLKAIGFAGNLPDHVIVLSIPDWGVTPFALSNGKDVNQVATEIDAFNEAKKEVCNQYGVEFIDITAEYRQIGGQPDMLVEDQLHPSGLVYRSWAEKLYQSIKTNRE